MAKYIDADKLIAEIERLHKEHSGKYGCDEVGVNLEYLEDFIDSIQQEQADTLESEKPIFSGNLEKEIETAFIENKCGVAECTGLTFCAFARIARHFAQWGAEHLKK